MFTRQHLRKLSDFLQLMIRTDRAQGNYKNIRTLGKVAFFNTKVRGKIRTETLRVGMYAIG